VLIVKFILRLKMAGVGFNGLSWSLSHDSNAISA
jgi:hypothetical protein